jgi:transposase-like protein
MSNQTYSQADRRQALRLHKKGWGYLRIAEIIGCYPMTIKRWVERANLKKHPGPAHSAKVRQKAIAAYKRATGKTKIAVSLSGLAKEHGVHVSTLSRWLSKSGIRHKKARRPHAFDHAAIEAELKAGKSGVDVALSHGCSESLVSNIRKKMRK